MNLLIFLTVIVTFQPGERPSSRLPIAALDAFLRPPTPTLPATLSSTEILPPPNRSLPQSNQVQSRGSRCEERLQSHHTVHVSKTCEVSGEWNGEIDSGRNRSGQPVMSEVGYVSDEKPDVVVSTPDLIHWLMLF